MGEVVALQSMPYSATTLHEIILENTRKGNRIFGVFVRDLPDLPSSDGWYYDVFVIMPGSGWVFASKTYTKTLYRRYMYDGNWAGDWELDPTATPPQEMALPLAAGVTRGRKCTYSKAQDGFVVVSFNLNFAQADGRTKAIATLPPGYLPAEIESDDCIVATNPGEVLGPAVVEVDPNGTVRVYANAAGYTNVRGKIFFYAT